MAKVLLVGCGDLGTEIAQLLDAAGHDLVGVRLSDKPLLNHLPCIQVDVTQPLPLNLFVDIQPAIIIYCVAANAQSDESYRAHYVDGLRNVLATQTRNRQLQHVFFISSTRVYGQKSDEVLNENSPALPNDFGGERLLEAESLLKGLRCGATTVRLSGIYGPGRLMMINLAKEPNRWPQVNRWTNRIHRDDAARFVAFLCEKVVSEENVHDCYIGADDMPELQYDVLRWIAHQLNIDVHSMGSEKPIAGKRLSNQRMHDIGFQLTYPNYQCGYREIINNV